MSAFVHACERPGPVRDSFPRRACPLQHRELDREIPNRRAFRNATDKFKTCGLARETIQKLIKTAATYNREPLQLLVRNRRRISQDFRIARSQAVKNERCILRHRGSAFFKRSQPTSLKLCVDARRHVAVQQQIRVVHLKKILWRRPRLRRNDGGVRGRPIDARIVEFT